MSKYFWQMLFLVLIGVVTWLVTVGWRLPFAGMPGSGGLIVWLPAPQLSGNSMAPTLFGEHHEAVCSECGFVNHYVVESYPAAQYYCGRCKLAVPVADFPKRFGDQVEFVQETNLNRWDVVLVREPQEPLRIVKRLVGLPGEVLQIKAGDLWIDGERIERSLDQILQTRIVLDRQLLSVQLPKRSSDNGWRFSDSGVSEEGEPTTSKSEQVLQYFHREPWEMDEAVKRSRILPGAIVSDWYPINPAYVGSLWPVRDQLLEIYFVPQSAGAIDLSLRDPSQVEPSCLRVDPWKIGWRDGVLEVGSEKVVLPVQKATASGSCGWKIVAAYCDGAYWLRVIQGEMDAEGKGLLNEQTVCELKKLEMEVPAVQRESCPRDLLWQVRVQGVVDWGYGEVSRDIYFRGDEWSELRGLPVVRHLEGYFLLGDNQPISLDGRQKEGWLEGLPRGWIEGKIRLSK
jgi:signal peptidase I